MQLKCKLVILVIAIRNYLLKNRIYFTLNFVILTVFLVLKLLIIIKIYIKDKQYRRIEEQLVNLMHNFFILN